MSEEFLQNRLEINSNLACYEMGAKNSAHTLMKLEQKI